MSIKPLIYRSTDAGAPQLTGQAGSLVAVLDAVLVNGYGVGVDAKTPAGWTLEFSGTNKRVYRNSVTHGTGTYLRVDDTGSEQLADTRVALVRAYEGMTGVDGGVNPCPTNAQQVAGGYVLKSTAVSAPRAWMLVACSTYFYLFIDSNGETASGWAGLPRAPTFCGDFDSLVPGDDFCFAIGGDFRGGLSLNADYSGQFFRSNVTWFGGPAAGSSMYCLRGYSGVVGSAPASNKGLATTGTWGEVGSYPNPVTQGVMVERGLIGEGVQQLRGFMPGLLVPLHNRPFTEGLVLPSLPGYSDRRFVAKFFQVAHGALNSWNVQIGQVLLEAYEHG